MRPLHLLVNRAAGGGRALRTAASVADALRAIGARPRVTISPAVAAADDLVSACADAGEAAVAVGGDGMVGSLIGAAVRRRVPLGIVPAGRGNDFARQLGLPSRPTDLANLLVGGRIRPVDVLECADRTVIGSVYVGVDSRTSELVNPMRLLPAALQYPLGGLAALLTFPGLDYRVTIDGVVHEYRGYTAVAANSGYYGKGMHIAPGADVHDGLIDVVMIRAGSRARFIAGFPGLYAGRHVARNEVSVLRGRTVRIEADGGPAYADGDPLAPLPVTVTVHPGAAAMILP